jgi:hypothetical protein
MPKKGHKAGKESNGRPATSQRKRAKELKAHQAQRHAEQQLARSQSKRAKRRVGDQATK